jgi:hypothetical protein
MRRTDLDRRVVTRTEEVARPVDGDDRLAAEDVEAFLKGMDVRVNRPSRRELVHAQAGVHRAGRMIDERGAAITLAVPRERGVVFQRRFFETSEMMH